MMSLAVLCSAVLQTVSLTSFSVPAGIYPAGITGFSRLFSDVLRDYFSIDLPFFYLYLLINGTMNCFAIFRYLCNKDTACLITLIGAVLFFISDTSLFFVRFKKDGRLKTHFLVMLTYSIGEFLIVLGLILK